MPIFLANLIWSNNLAFSQEIQFSRPQKIPSKIDQYEIIGKSADEILIHKWGDRFHLLEAFNLDDLKPKWSKEMIFEDVKSKNEIVDIFINKRDLDIIFTTKKKRQTALFIKRTTSGLNPLIKPVLLDTIVNKIGSFGNKFLTSQSKDKNLLAVIRYDYNFARVEYVKSILLDEDFNRIGEYEFEVEENTRVKDVIVANSGIVITCAVKTKRSIVNNSPRIVDIEIKLYNPNTNELNNIKIDKGGFPLEDVRFGFDNKNNRLVIGGFYSEKQSNYVEGYFYAFYDLETEKVSQKTFEPFSSSVKLKLNSRNEYKTETQGIPYLEVKQLILRNDGGALLIGESVHTSKENFALSTLDNFYSRQMAISTNYFHNDMVVLSINPDGTLYWDNVLTKKQFSEGDGGYFSSYGMFNHRRDLHLLFNEDISYKTNFNSYGLTSDGQYKVTSILNMRQYELMVAPQYSKQLSANVLLVPAFNSRNEFMLAKISF